MKSVVPKWSRAPRPHSTTRTPALPPEAVRLAIAVLWATLQELFRERLSSIPNLLDHG